MKNGASTNMETEKDADKNLLVNNEFVDVETGDYNAQLSTSKSPEFDPVTSNLGKEVLTDEYAAVIVEDDSPYAEVRAAVPSSDDALLPQNTIRMWTLGLIFTTIGCALNLLFSLHQPSIIITTFVTSILAWPVGLLWLVSSPT